MDGNSRSAEVSTDDQAKLFCILAENTTDIVIWSDLDTTRRYVSPAVKNILGYDPEELVGTKPIDFIHPEDTHRFQTTLDELYRGAIESALTTQRYRRKNGQYVWIEALFSLTRDHAEGPATGLVASLRDVSNRKQVEESLRISEERLAMALDSGSDGVWDWNVKSGYVAHSGKWHLLMGFGLDGTEPTMQAWSALVHSDDRPSANQAFTDHLKGLTPSFKIELRIMSKRTGGYRWTYTRGRVVERDLNGRAIRVVGSHIDITQRKEAEMTIAHMALHDPLTGLANRTLFHDRLEQQISSFEQHDRNLVLLACDLDYFKAVNDLMGHCAGDALLRAIADRLRQTASERDTVARLGGDEFAIIMHGSAHSSEAIGLAQRIVAAVQQPVIFEGHALVVSMSIGIAIWTGQDQTCSADELLKKADIALYRAKADGRNAFCVFETGMISQKTKRNELVQELQRAVEKQEFVLNYQPIVDLATGVVGGFEALLRWHHPDRGTIQPNDFISTAEESGLIVPIGKWVLNEACRQAATWPKHLRMAVNVSAVQFNHPQLFQSDVVAALATSGLAASRLELEITEGVLLKDAETVIMCLRGLRELGVSIALDDFGTGFSSLTYLRRFPFDKIKIGQSFVHEIADADTAEIVKAVVGLAKRAGAGVTAEGVETEEHLAYVIASGCTQMQGFLFSAPLDWLEADRMAVAKPSVPPSKRRRAR